MNTDFMNDIKNSANSFAESQKKLHETMCNPDTSKIQNAINSKRETDKQDLLEELKIQNAVLTEQIKAVKRGSFRTTLIASALASIVGVILGHFLPALIEWFKGIFV